MKMKVQTTAIVAIVAVFAIVLASASGVTYSWFTDSDEAEIDVSTAKVQTHLPHIPTIDDNFVNRRSTAMATRCC